MYRYISFELYQKLSKVLKENNLNFKKIDSANQNHSHSL